MILVVGISACKNTSNKAQKAPAPDTDKRLEAKAPPAKATIKKTKLSSKFEAVFSGGSWTLKNVEETGLPVNVIAKVVPVPVDLKSKVKNMVSLSWEVEGKKRDFGVGALLELNTGEIAVVEGSANEQNVKDKLGDSDRVFKVPSKDAEKVTVVETGETGYCMGEERDNDRMKSCDELVCDQWICLSAAGGILEVSGRWAEDGHYSSKKLKRHYDE